MIRSGILYLIFFGLTYYFLEYMDWLQDGDTWKWLASALGGFTIGGFFDSFITKYRETR